MRTQHWLMLSAAMMSLAVLPACQTASHDAPATQAAAPAQPAASARPINKFCAVEQDNPVDDRVPTYTYKGQVIGFCCPDCVDQFKANPDKYMATLK